MYFSFDRCIEITLILQGVPQLGGVKQGWGEKGKPSHFKLNVSISRKR